MVSEEIVGGIKNALERGNSLRDAMISFFNAGYDRKEIEEAAAILLNYQPTVKTESTIPVPVMKMVEVKKEISPPKVIQKVSGYGEDNAPTSKTIFLQQSIPEMSKPIVQTSSNFVSQELPKAINVMPQTNAKKIEVSAQKKISSSKMTPQGKVLVAILVGLLIFLIGLLVVIFLFRPQLIDFISSMVS